jgi:protein kinase N
VLFFKNNFIINYDKIYFNFDLQQAQANLSESSCKLDLLRRSLELRRQELPANSTTAVQLVRELQNAQAASPTPNHAYVSLQPFPKAERNVIPEKATVSRCAAVTGKLEVRLVSSFTALLYILPKKCF